MSRRRDASKHDTSTSTSTMWIFTTYGFFSFTQSTFRPGFIQIRARDDRDLRDLARRHHLRGRIVETSNSDYRWRILCRQSTAARILADEMKAIDYDNFKDATTPRQHARPLMSVWSAMMGVQRDRESELGIARQTGPGRELADPEAAEDYVRQQRLFDDGTLDEDALDEDDWRHGRIHEAKVPPHVFEPSYEEAAGYGDDLEERDEELRRAGIPTMDDEIRCHNESLSESAPEPEEIPF